MADSIKYDIKINNQQAVDSINDLWEKARAGSESAARTLNSKLGGTIKTELVFQTEVDDNGIKTLKAETNEVLTAYDKLASKQNQFNKTQQGSVTSLRQQVNAAKQLRDGIAKIAITTDETTNTVKGELNPAWVEANNNVKDLSLQLAQAEGNILAMAKAQFPIIGKILSLGNAFTQVTFIAQGVVQVFQAIGAAFAPIIQRAKQIEGLTLALSAFVAESENIEAVLSSSKAIALEYGVSLAQVEKGYKRIAPAILASGGSLEDVEAVMESLSAKTVQLGLNSEQSGRYIEAFAQVMGKNKLQAEELNQQFSELDGALRSQIALYLDIQYGITDINEAMRDGEVTAQLFREAFVAAAQSARDNLSGALDGVLSRIDSMNISQIENIRNTLNSISAEALSRTFDEVGTAIQRMSTGFTAFFAAFSTNLPNLADYFGDLFAVLAQNVGIFVQGFLNGIFIILKALDGLAWLLAKIADGIKFITFGNQLEGLWTNLTQRFWEGSQAILALGENVKASKGDFTALAAEAEVLKEQLDAGLITSEEYKKALEKMYANTTEQSKLLLESFEAEESALDDLKEKINERFDEENEKIQESIDLKKEALEQEKASLREVTDILKENYEARRDAIKEEINAIKDKYALEIENAQALTFAQKEEQRLRKEKLQAIVNSSTASYEEKIAAQSTLDRMQQQVKVAEIKKKQQEEIARKEKEQAELTKKYNEERKAAEEASLARQESIQVAIERLTEELKGNEEKQKAYNAQIEESTRLTEEQINTLDDIPGILDEQISKVETARDRYWEAADAARELADELERANSADSRRGNSRRASGGPVAGG